MKSIKRVIENWSLCSVAGICFALFSLLPGIAALAVLLCIIGLSATGKNKGKRGRFFAIVGLVLSGAQLFANLVSGGSSMPGGAQSYLLLLVLGFGTFLLSLVFLWLFSAMWNSDNLKPPAAPERSRPQPEKTAAEPVLKKPLPASAYLPACMCSIECEEGKLIYSSDHRLMKEKQEFDTEAPDMPFDIVVSRCLAEFICNELDYEFERASIGGGSDEVSHTGTVAYHASFDTLDSFVYQVDEHYRNAAADAAADYRGWFTGLDYNFIIMDFKKPGCSLRVHWDSRIKLIFTFDVRFLEGERLSRMHDYLFAGKHAVFADTLRYDRSMHKLRQVIQLDNHRRFFLSAFVGENGGVEKLSLDIEEANDRHYEFTGAAIESFRAKLENKFGRKSSPLPTLCAAVLADFGAAELEAIANSCCSALFGY